MLCFTVELCILIDLVKQNIFWYWFRNQIYQAVNEFQPTLNTQITLWAFSPTNVGVQNIIVKPLMNRCNVFGKEKNINTEVLLIITVNEDMFCSLIFCF